MSPNLCLKGEEPQQLPPSGTHLSPVCAPSSSFSPNQLPPFWIASHASTSSEVVGDELWTDSAKRPADVSHCVNTVYLLLLLDCLQVALLALAVQTKSTLTPWLVATLLLLLPTSYNTNPFDT